MEADVVRERVWVTLEMDRLSLPCHAAGLAAAFAKVPRAVTSDTASEDLPL